MGSVRVLLFLRKHQNDARDGEPIVLQIDILPAQTKYPHRDAAPGAALTTADGTAHAHGDSGLACRFASESSALASSKDKRSCEYCRSGGAPSLAWDFCGSSSLLYRPGQRGAQRSQ